MRFVNLHAHTTFSIADGLNYPKDHFDFVIKNAESESMAMAISDHGNANAFGYAFQAIKDYKKKGINFKFIPGFEAYYHPDLEQWKKDKNTKEQEKEDEEDTGVVVEVESESKGKWYDPIKRRHHLVVLAYNQQGLKNLYRLISRSYREGFYRYPRIDNRMLERYNEGLIISTACIHPDAKLITSEGTITMKEVVDLVNSGEEVYVLGWSEQENKQKFNKVSWAAKTRENAKLFKIKLKDGKELKLTSDHKVYTDQGWVEARNLTRDHKILTI